MDESTLKNLAEISANEKRFAALYRKASIKFGLPDARMWILYFLIFSDDEITQLDVAERMILPKQTVNSAALWLEKAGCINILRIPGVKRKKLVLTSEGRKLAETTVGRVLRAECKAVEGMGSERFAAYISLYAEFYGLMNESFEEEGIA